MEAMEAIARRRNISINISFGRCGIGLGVIFGPGAEVVVCGVTEVEVTFILKNTDL